MNVLDVGCGGSGSFKISRSRGTVNCDILKPTRKIDNFIQCDAHHLPIKFECFDKVIMFDVIEHVENPLEVLREARRVLKNKGLLELGTPNALFLTKIVRSILKGNYFPHKDHIATYGKPELENLLSHIFFNPSVTFLTYFDDTKRWYYRFLIRICPFPALKHRQLYTITRKEKEK